jgi:Xaa-Pro aminopeptidase
LSAEHAAPNLERASMLMAECGLDAVVACSPVTVRWLTGFGNWLGPSFREYMVRPGGSDDLVQRTFALLPRGGRPVLVVEPSFVLDATEAAADDVRVAGAAALAPGSGTSGPHAVGRDDPARALLLPRDWPADPVVALVALLEEHGLSASRLGVEDGALLERERRQIESALPAATLRDCRALFRFARTVKTAREIELLEHVTSIGEGAARRTAASADPVTTPADLVDRFRMFAAEDGADLDHVAISLDGLAFSTGGRRPVGDGSSMFFDYGCAYRGWISDSGTTLCVGEPEPSVLAWHDAVRRAVEAGADLLRPGVRGSTVQAAMQRTLADEGITDAVPQGHGIGLEIREHPVLVPADGRSLRDDCIELNADLMLEEDMVLNLEATVHFVGEWSVHCEQSFVITGHGCRLLVDQHREGPFVGGSRDG